MDMALEGIPDLGPPELGWDYLRPQLCYDQHIDVTGKISSPLGYRAEQISPALESENRILHARKKLFLDPDEISEYLREKKRHLRYW